TFDRHAACGIARETQPASDIPGAGGLQLEAQVCAAPRFRSRQHTVQAKGRSAGSRLELQWPAQLVHERWQVAPLQAPRERLTEQRSPRLTIQLSTCRDGDVQGVEPELHRFAAFDVPVAQPGLRHTYLHVERAHDGAEMVAAPLQTQLEAPKLTL